MTVLPDLNPAATAARLETHKRRHNDPEFTVLLCLNCHAEASEDQRVTGVLKPPSADNPLLRLHRWLVSLAAFFLQLVNALLRQADLLAAFIDRLSEAFPGWHEVTA